jgi:hypothetical protein
MRHSDIKLTMNVYTDPKLLDVRGALDALPALPLSPAPDAVLATGTAGIMEKVIRLLAPTLAPTSDKSGHLGVSVVNAIRPGHSAQCSDEFAVSAMPDKRKEPLTFPVNGSSRQGDWIRTSDLLNPIHEAASKKGRFSEPFRDQRFPSITNFTRIAVLGQGFYCPYCPQSQPIELQWRSTEQLETLRRRSGLSDGLM